MIDMQAIAAVLTLLFFYLLPVVFYVEHMRNVK